MNRKDAYQALRLYDDLERLSKFRSVAESYFAVASVTVDNTANDQRTLTVAPDTARKIVYDQVAAVEHELTTLGFDPKDDDR